MTMMALPSESGVSLVRYASDGHIIKEAWAEMHDQYIVRFNFGARVYSGRGLESSVVLHPVHNAYRIIRGRHCG